jgi:ribosomal 30S subunit maturation factor RimM
VKRLFTNGAHDVVEVAGAGREAGKLRLLPWVPAVVKEVDLAEGRIYVRWGADW